MHGGAARSAAKRRGRHGQAVLNCRAETVPASRMVPTMVANDALLPARGYGVQDMAEQTAGCNA
jgi:hypothetical protein